MKKTSNLPFMLFLIYALMLSACGQAAGTTAQTLTTQVSLPSQASSTATATAIVPQFATAVPTQQSGGSGTAFVAYASGLASNFTKGDICSLAQPFSLEGDALPVSSGFSSNFQPTSATQGNYTFINNISAGGCVDTSSGTYEVSFYSDSEGEIFMTGVATRVCEGVTTFSGTTEFRIAIRKAQLLACP